MAERLCKEHTMQAITKNLDLGMERKMNVKGILVVDSNDKLVM